MQVSLSNLKDHFVAYIDILGFTDMVKNDFLINPKNPLYITKLYDFHKSMQSLITNESEDIGFIQFSDSIVISTEYDKSKFVNFVKLISKFQYDLFCEGIFCRGGIAYGKHFFENNFMYSHGLIEAYIIENEISINPKIVISSDLFELLYPYNNVDSNLCVLKDEDGTIFIDYLKNYDSADCDKILSAVTLRKNTNPKVISKYRWLNRYINFKQISTQNTNVSTFEEV
ncbi:hypothetical protein MmiEs2_11830 [Methanimicrococcus stummii]|uniref:Uncharacterized protein n=2 Tax=Methanimicrococcus stummii TaxID=3028294 RepID=A0AA96ZXF9_9EURY|nr:hypothetical protein MmiEs2_11830 [Methanimicrococcus sp. Es2]